MKRTILAACIVLAAFALSAQTNCQKVRPAKAMQYDNSMIISIGGGYQTNAGPLAYIGLGYDIRHFMFDVHIGYMDGVAVEANILGKFFQSGSVKLYAGLNIGYFDNLTAVKKEGVTATTLQGGVVLGIEAKLYRKETFSANFFFEAVGKYALTSSSMNKFGATTQAGLRFTF